MKNIIQIIFVTAVMLSSIEALADTNIPSFQKRAQVVELSERLSRAESAPLQLPPVRNPFSLNALALEQSDRAVQIPAKRKAASDRELLQMLVEQMDPKGTLVSPQGESIIRLGQKMIRVGETLPVVLEGVIYEVEITSIESSKFTVRYKNEELTRSIIIKQGKNP